MTKKSRKKPVNDEQGIVRRKRHNREVNRRSPTVSQLAKIVSAQQRRADLTPEQRAVRREELRLANGHPTRAQRLFSASVRRTFASLPLMDKAVGGYNSNGQLSVAPSSLPANNRISRNGGGAQ